MDARNRVFNLSGESCWMGRFFVLLFVQIFSANFMLEGGKAFHFLNFCIFAFQQIFLDINEMFLGK